MVVVDPLRCQYTVGVLSWELWIVCSATSAHWQRMSWWAMEPANSKSLLEMVPEGLERETRALATAAGNRERQTRG